MILWFVVAMFVIYVATAGPSLGYAMLLPFSDGANGLGGLRKQNRRASELWVLLAFIAVWWQTNAWGVLAPFLQVPLVVMTALLLVYHGLILWHCRQQSAHDSTSGFVRFVVAGLAFVIACLQGFMLALFLGLEHVAATPAFIVTLCSLFLTPPIMYMMLALIRMPSAPFTDRLLLGMALTLFAMIAVCSLIPILTPSSLWHQLPIGVWLSLIPLTLIVTTLALIQSLRASMGSAQSNVLLSPLTLTYGVIVLVVVAYIVTLRTMHVEGLMAVIFVESLLPLFVLVFLAVGLGWWHHAVQEATAGDDSVRAVLKNMWSGLAARLKVHKPEE
ncbi:MAG: hypothetical protein GDA50_07785 [Alphaproteobacteria bacterium GM202ARS2]|nr:hypothetical protein [Alphaproteobacteria bacterium GM202ARS2]